MMPIHQAYLPILAAVLSEMAVGYLWYSDYAFGPMMREIAGRTKKREMSLEIIMHILTAIIKATALFIAISMLQNISTAGYFKEGLGRIFTLFIHDPSTNNNSMSLALKTAGFAWLGFMFPARAACNIWGDRNLKKLLITAGGQCAMTMAMAATIATLS